jgi:hypothetical protein
MADVCDPIRDQVAELTDQLSQINKFEPPEPGQHPKEITQEWSDKNKELNTAKGRLQACLKTLPPRPPQPPPTPVPLTLTLTNFVCLDQSDEIRVFGFNTEDDEPYALVFAVDLQKATPLGIPAGAANCKMTLVGPLSDVDVDDNTVAPPNVIYGLSDVPDFVSSANNLIVLVAMMENDDGSPDQARSVLETAARFELLSNLPAFTANQIPRQELVNRIISGMAGAMGAAKVGLPGPDDNIGTIQELRFFQFDLDDIYRNIGRSSEKSLTFEGDDAKYVLKFRMFR